MPVVSSLQPSRYSQTGLAWWESVWAIGNWATCLPFASGNPALADKRPITMR
ncbi:MAG: hypothetical protein LBJ08_12700 [Bifidobacteriaceae bacterium]|nr:hypothetical protein [Bifidobacteriaceae bacterium]